MQAADAPGLDGITAWFNTTPLDLEDLRGKPVLLDFWRYSSLACSRMLPAMQQLWETYRDAGLVVIGVHTPEFRFEADPDHMLAAVNDAEITYPVGLDAEQATWQAYGNMTRNRRTLIGPDGRIRYEDIGFGHLGEMEQHVRSTLTRSGAELPDPCFDAEPAVDEPVALASPTIPAGNDGPPLGNAATQACAPYTPLTYDDRYPDRHRLNRLYLHGEWVQRDDHVEYRGEEERDYAALRFTGRDVHLVVSAPRPRTRIGVMLEHEPVPPDRRGDHIVAEGNRTYVVVDRPGRYYVANLAEPSVAELTFIPEDRVRLHAFRFV